MIASRFFEDYEAGYVRETLGRTITETTLAARRQTGDFYPHHMDEEWCRTQPSAAARPRHAHLQRGGRHDRWPRESGSSPMATIVCALFGRSYRRYDSRAGHHSG